MISTQLRYIILIWFTLVGLATSLGGGENAHVTSWVESSAESVIDLSTLKLQLDTENPSFNSSWFVGIGVGFRQDLSRESHMYLDCCNHREGNCPDKSLKQNEPFVTEASQDVVAMYQQQISSPDEIISFDIQVPINVSGWYDVAIMFCEGSYHSFRGWPRLKFTSRPRFISKSWILSPHARFFLVCCAVVSLLGLITLANTFKSQETSIVGNKRHGMVSLGRIVLLLVIVESISRFGNIYIFNRLNLTENPRAAQIGIQVIRSFRIGLLGFYIQGIIRGLDVIQPFQDGANKTVLVSSSMMTLVCICAPFVIGLNIEGLFNPLICFVASTIGHIQTKRLLQQSHIPHAKVEVYRIQLIQMLIFGVGGLIGYALLTTLYPYDFDESAEVDKFLPPWFYCWETIIYWNLNIIWFLFRTVNKFRESNRSVEYKSGNFSDC